MSSAVFKLTSGASTNLSQIGGADGGTTVTGYEIYNTSAAAEFVKLYWAAPGKFSSGGQAPTVGTDVPNVTIYVPTVGPARQTYYSPIRGQGTLWLATTTGAADSNSTAVAAGDLIISIFYE